jgi:TATA-box binding protein (TBP) (component of TFIID and TFIIIB)
LEDEYGLTAQELLDAVNQRFRAKVALEGVVAEAQFERKLRILKQAGKIADYSMYDKDDYPDFSIRLSEDGPEYTIEVKNIRDAEEAYKTGGEVVAYKVEL